MNDKLKMINVKPGDKNPGSVVRLFRKMINRTDRVAAEVPCGSCNACCRSKKLFVDLRPGELEQFPEAVWEPTINNMILPKDEDGVCVHLVDNKCTIYDRRPQACKGYDCRVHLLVGVFDNEDSPIFEAVKQWDMLKAPTVEDQVLSIAIRMAIIEDGKPPKDALDAWRKVIFAYSVPSRWQKLLATAGQVRRGLIDMPTEQRRQLADEISSAFGEAQ